MADQTNLTDFTNRDDPPTSGEKPDSNPERYKDEEWLHEQYWELGRSMADIAEEVSVTATTIGRWMKKHGIERRSQKEIQSDDNIEQLKDEDWLLKQYHELEKSLQDIADSLGTTPPTVNQYMENHGIERRAISESRAATDLSRLRSDPEWLAEQYHGRDRTMGEIADELGTYASTVKQWLHNHGIETDSEAEAKSDGDISRLADEEWLYSQYWEHGLTTYEIADEVGTSVQPVLRLMNKYGIERRSSSAAQTDADLEKLENEEWLHRQYCQKERTVNYPCLLSHLRRLP